MRPQKDTAIGLPFLLEAIQKRKGSNIKIALDLETDGLDPLVADITWVSWCLSGDEYGAIPVQHHNPSRCNEDPERVKEVLRTLHHDPRNMIAWHNAVYDLAVLKCREWLHPDDIQARVFDTMLASYLLNPVKTREGGDHKLKTLYDELVRSPDEEKQPDFDTICKGLPFVDVPIESAAFYATFDAFTTYFLVTTLENKLSDQNLLEYFWGIEMPHLFTTLEVTTSGIRLLSSEDEVKAHNLSCQPDDVIYTVSEYQEELEVIQAKIFEMTGKTFNLSSPDALRKLLFGGDLDVEPFGKARAGGYLIDKDTLTKIFCNQDDTFVRKLLAYILYAKQLMTTISKHVEMVEGSVWLNKAARTKVIYPQLRPTTSSGRYAGRSPNMLSLSSSSGIKKHLVPRDGWTFVIGDFSQIDLRVIANETAEVKATSKMCADVNSGVDLHLNTLRIVDRRVQPHWKKLLKDKTDKQKIIGYIDMHGKEHPQPVGEHAFYTGLQKKRGDVAKPLNFGVSYGLGPRKLQSNLNTTDEFRDQVIELPEGGMKDNEWLEKIKVALERDEHTLADVKGYLDKFHEEYPDIREFQSRVERDLALGGTTRNLFGRECRAEILPLLARLNTKDRIALDVCFGRGKWYRVRVADFKVEPDGLRCRLKRVNHLVTSDPLGKRKVEKSDLIRTEDYKIYEVEEINLRSAWRDYFQSMQPSTLFDRLAEVHDEACWDEGDFFKLLPPDIPAVPPFWLQGDLSEIFSPVYPYVSIPHEAIERVLIDGADVDLRYPGYDKLRRNLISSRVSSTSMDFCKIAMIEFRKLVAKKWPDIKVRPRIINCIHDEIAVECRLEDQPEVCKILRESMESDLIFQKYVDRSNGRRLLVKIEAEIGTGGSYAAAKP